MNQYDEYQKQLRYRYGYHSFFILEILIIVNFFLRTFYNIQWGESVLFETMVLLIIANLYSMIMIIYHGAYFTKWQKPKLFVALFTLMGLVFIYQSLSPYNAIIENGKLALGSISLITGIFWLPFPLTYAARTIREKYRDDE